MAAGEDDIGDYDPAAASAISRELFFFSLEDRTHAVERRARADRGEFTKAPPPPKARPAAGRAPRRLDPSVDRIGSAAHPFGIPGRGQGRGTAAGTGVVSNRGRSYTEARPTEQFNVRIDPDVKAAIQERSRLGNRPLGALVESIFRDFLDGKNRFESKPATAAIEPVADEAVDSDGGGDGNDQ